MNYETLYYRFIEDRRQRPISSEVYSERHHILPRCEGGTDEVKNLIQLTARDHLFAHLILAKWKGGVHWFVFVMMGGRKDMPSVRALVSGREKLGKLMTEKLKGNQSAKGNILSTQTRQRMSEAQRGNKNAQGMVHSSETRSRIGDWSRGKPKSEQTKSRMRKAWARRRQNAS